jgi:hypothetical protein
MTYIKRQRGRPRGSGKDDASYLIRIADLLVRNPSMKPTAAMKLLIKERKNWDATDTTLLRRWQVKWKANGDELLAAAHERARPRPPAVPAHLTIFSLIQALKAGESSPYFKIIRDAQEAAEKSPWLKTLREMENLPFIRAMREMENSPAIQAFKKWNDLSAMPAGRRMKHGAFEP